MQRRPLKGAFGEALDARDLMLRGQQNMGVSFGNVSVSAGAPQSAYYTASTVGR